MYKLTGISINNFRVFKEKTSFRFAPITILTGTNSSGKSSLIKALNLLKRSYFSSGLIELDLMQSELKLGGFLSITNFHQKRKPVSFEIEIEHVSLFNQPIKCYTFQLIYREWGLESLRVSDKSGLLAVVEKKISENKKQWHHLPISKSYIRLPNTIIKKDVLKEKLRHLNTDEFENLCKAIMDYLENSSELHSNKSTAFQFWLDNKNWDILDFLNSMLKDGIANIGEKEIYEREFFDATRGEAIPYTSEFTISEDPTLGDVVSKVDLHKIGDQYKNLKLVAFINREEIKKNEVIPNDILRNLFFQFEFIEGVRATQEIVYTKENNPVFFELLKSLQNQEEIRQKISEWLDLYFGIKSEQTKRGVEELISIKEIAGYGYLFTLGGQNEIPLSGMGYGFTQLIPILMKVGICKNFTLVIEEPESNLHPALQSKLADFFNEAIRDTFPLDTRRFIIETHSEYLIRKLQYLVAKGELKEDDIQIYYFNSPENKEHDQIIDIRINKDGSLTDDFGPGFFDEADNIALDLFLLKQSQNN